MKLMKFSENFNMEMTICARGSKIKADVSIDIQKLDLTLKYGAVHVRKR